MNNIVYTPLNEREESGFIGTMFNRLSTWVPRMARYGKAKSVMSSYIKKITSKTNIIIDKFKSELEKSLNEINKREKELQTQLSKSDDKIERKTVENQLEKLLKDTEQLLSTRVNQLEKSVDDLITIYTKSLDDRISKPGWLLNVELSDEAQTQLKFAWEFLVSQFKQEFFMKLTTLINNTNVKGIEKIIAKLSAQVDELKDTYRYSNLKKVETFKSKVTSNTDMLEYFIEEYVEDKSSYQKIGIEKPYNIKGSKKWSRVKLGAKNGFFGFYYFSPGDADTGNMTKFEKFDSTEEIDEICELILDTILYGNFGTRKTTSYEKNIEIDKSKEVEEESEKPKEEIINPKEKLAIESIESEIESIQNKIEDIQNKIHKKNLYSKEYYLNQVKKGKLSDKEASIKINKIPEKRKVWGKDVLAIQKDIDKLTNEIKKESLESRFSEDINSINIAFTEIKKDLNKYAYYSKSELKTESMSFQSFNSYLEKIN